MRGRAAVSIIGRAAERARLYDVLSAVGEGRPQVMLIAGDAGIGKTSLVTDLALHAADLGFAVGIGHCLDIEAAMSFAPAVEAARGLLTDSAEVDDRPHARRMRTLLDPDAQEFDQVRMLDDLRLTFLEAAAHGPVLVALEDLHWADRSTQQLVSALARTAHGRLLLVLTVRSDELPRGHPARTALAEVTRLDTASCIDLAPLEPPDVAALLLERSGSAWDATEVASIHERSEGNPLYAEELIDADPHAVPEHLSDLLLARVAKLSRESRSLVRAASVDGSHLDTELLATVTGLEPDVFDTLLREAIDQQVLRQRAGRVEFRHGLLREVVYQDLLPDERTRIHRAFAGAIQARIDDQQESGLPTLGKLAFHWNAAHDVGRTLVASTLAGLAARRLGAAETVTQLERVMTLWDRVPDADALTGLAKPELVVLLAEAAHDQGDIERWHAMVREAVGMLQADTDPLVASRVYSALGECFLLRRDTVARGEAIRLAVERAGRQPSEELARALVAQSSYLISREQFTAALKASLEAAEVARAADCVEALLPALRNSAVAMEKLGRLEEAASLQGEGIRIGRGNGLTGSALEDVAYLARGLIVSGQVTRGVEIARAGFDEALSLGLPERAAFCGEQVQVAAVWQGRLEEAASLLTRLELLGMPDYRRLFLRRDLLLARGEVETADPLVREVARVWTEVSGIPEDNDVLSQIRLAAMRDRATDAVAVASSYIAQLAEGDSALRAAAAARIGFQSLVLARSAPGVETAELRDLSAFQLRRAQAGLAEAWRGSYYGLQLMLAEAFEAMSAGEPASQPLREALTLAESFGAYLALEPRLLLAEDLLAFGERDEGRELLVAASSDARAMDASDHERRALRLATRARIPISGDARVSGPLALLTPREREVLDLLGDGATNRAIAGALFISEKTASVHVSHLLAKLGVPNRGAAAALARRLGS